MSAADSQAEPGHPRAGTVQAPLAHAGTVQAPLAHAGTTPASLRSLAPLPATSSVLYPATKRVLVVDDELSNRRLVARMLQRLQATTVCLEDGDEVRLPLWLYLPQPARIMMRLLPPCRARFGTWPQSRVNPVWLRGRLCCGARRSWRPYCQRGTCWRRATSTTRAARTRSALAPPPGPPPALPPTTIPVPCCRSRPAVGGAAPC